MSKTFTLEQFIEQLQSNKLLIEPINSFDLIELGIRCAKSFCTIYKESAPKVEKEIQGKNKVITLQINQYPDTFKERVIIIIDKYLWQRRKKRLVTAFQWKKKKELWLAEKAKQYRKRD